MPEDLKLSQIGSSQLPPPFRGLHSPGVRKHCQIIFACYFRKSSISTLSPFLIGRMFVRPNILRTLRRTMIRFLIELLVRRIWSGHSKLYFILNWLVMRCAFHKSTNKQIPSEASEEPSDTVIHFYFCFFFIHRRALLSANQRQ